MIFNIGKSRLAAVMLTFLAQSATPAYALGSVSRACRFDQIPVEMQHTASLFFYAIGAEAEVLILPFRGSDYQSNYWVLESLTTDYGNVRYYLFASRLKYIWTQIQEGQNGSGAIFGYLYQSRLDSAWTAEQISSAMRTSPEFAPFYLNRQILYSARAGNPKIVEKLGVDPVKHYLIKGRHRAIDAQSGSLINVSDSEANTCNLTDIGIGTSLMDR